MCVCMYVFTIAIEGGFEDCVYMDATNTLLIVVYNTMNMLSPD